jgi:cytochrome c oxidase subunit II
LSTWGTTRRRGRVAAALLVPTLLAGCGGSQNALDPHSHASTDIANLFWVMMAVAFGGLALVSGIMIAAWFRRGRAREREAGEHLGNKVVIGLGIVMPIAVVCALFIVGDALIVNVTQAPAASRGGLTVHAIGHQWWWEFKYQGTSADTADELHIPVNTHVNLVATTADVIHSFWVPTLNRKIDTIPEQRNEISLYSNRVGTFRGQCAEFCGLQHAHMGMLVIVQPKAAFQPGCGTSRPTRASPRAGTRRRGKRCSSRGRARAATRSAGRARAATSGPTSRTWPAGSGSQGS